MTPIGYISTTAAVQLASGGYEGVNIRAKVGDERFQSAWGEDIPLYTKQQIDKAIEERDSLIRDLRKELNERRYGRSASE